MQFRRLVGAMLALGVIVGAAYVAQGPGEELPGNQMVKAADTFLASLLPEQKQRAVFPFADPERSRWNFVPLQDKERKPTRKGLRFEEMTDKQKTAARALIRSGTSASGYEKAITIMSLESILNELEAGRGLVRNPEWYFVSIFGTPGKGPWGWRIEGHHLSLNFTLDGDKVTGSTPAFFGANPATVKAGPRKGLRTLPEAEETALQLFNSLDQEQLGLARQAKHFPEIEQAKTAPNLGPPVGVPASKLNEKQRELLRKLLEGYASRMPPLVAASELQRVKEGGEDNIHVAFSREDEKPGKPYTYRVHGPTFVIEFLNIQEDASKNPANHIHSSYRLLKGDFGLASR